MSDYPEHDKLTAVKDKSQAIGEFLEWLHNEKGQVIAEWQKGRFGEELFIVPGSIQDRLAEFFGIDQDKLEAEKRAMLAAIRAAS